MPKNIFAVAYMVGKKWITISGVIGSFVHMARSVLRMGTTIITNIRRIHLCNIFARDAIKYHSILAFMEKLVIAEDNTFPIFKLCPT